MFANSLDQNFSLEMNKRIVIFVTFAISVTFANMVPENVNMDNCQYAPGKWIGEGSDSDCHMYNINWDVEDFSDDATTLAITR